MKRVLWLAVALAAVALCGVPSAATAAEESVLGPARDAFQAGNYPEAIRLGLQELSRDPKSGAAHHLVGLAYQRTGNLVEAREHLERAHKQQSKDANIIYDLGTLYLQLQLYPEAQKTFQKALKFRKENKGRFHYGIGLGYLAQGQLDQALISFLKAREEDPQNAKIYAAIGEAYNQQNVPPLAVDNYREALKIDPADLEVRYALGKLLQRGGQYNEALEEFKEIARRDSTQAGPYFDMGNLFLAGRRYPEAITALNIFTKMRPDSFPGQLLLARAYYSERLVREALAAGERAAALDPSSVEVQRLVASAYYDLRDVEGASRALGRLEQMSPEGGLTAEELGRWGRSLMTLQRYPEAIGKFELALARDSTLADVHKDLGTLLVIEKRNEEAIPHLEKYAQAESGGGNAQFNLAIAYMGLKDWPKAIAALNEGLRQKPDNLEGWGWLASCYAQADSLEKMAEAYEQVIRLDPRASQAYQQVGYSNLVRKNYPKAIQALRKHVELEPQSEEGWLSLARAAVGGRQTELAKAAYTRVLQINPNNKEAAEELKRVRLLGN